MSIDKRFKYDFFEIIFEKNNQWCFDNFLLQLKIKLSLLGNNSWEVINFPTEKELMKKFEIACDYNQKYLENQKLNIIRVFCKREIIEE
jgi:D-alanine-D-alanine ligase-like ATP-grasp enzyme